MRRIAAALVLLSMCLAVVVMTGAKGEGSSGKKTYNIELDNAFGLVAGGDFRVGNVKAGRTTKFGVVKKKGEAPKALVTAEITQPGFGDLREDAECSVRPQSLIGEYYVDCQAGSSKKRLKSGATVPVEQTSSTIPTDLVNNIMRRPYRERLRLVINELGTGLAGRPDDLQEVLKRAHPGLRETSKVLRILGDQEEIIQNFIRDSDTVVAELENNKRDVVRFIREAGDTAEISATRRAELARTFERLPTFLDELRPTMQRLGELSDEQVPLLADLERAAPSLNEFLTRLGPFAEASRPAVRSLGRSSRAGTRAIRQGKQEVRELRSLARKSPRFAKPLKQFLVAADDRKYGAENDPRAKAAAPPAPDPTAIRGQGGFTAFEGLMDFFFWQTLSVNLVDDVSHMLRAGLTINNCSPISTDSPDTEGERAKFRQCNQYLGPNQPGITGLPGINGADPLAGTIRTRGASSRSARAAGKNGGDGGASGVKPEAPAKPGQRDLSKPKVALPPGLQNLLDKVTKPGVPLEEQKRRLKEQLPNGAPGGAGAGSENQLLDYLLGP